MPKKWNTHDYCLSGCWASAIINGDYSGLTAEESATLRAWLVQEQAFPHTHGFWDGFGETESLGFRRDDVTGLKSECYRARYVFQKQD